jgi:hypothetical protein
MNENELQILLDEIRRWLLEDRTELRVAKLEYLMKWGMLPSSEAVAMSEAYD